MNSIRYKFLGCCVDAITQVNAVSYISQLISQNVKHCVMFLNIDVLVKSDLNCKLRELSKQSSLCLMDGMPPLWIAKRRGIPLPEKVSGSDFVPNICEMASASGFSVFFLGGKSGVPEMAAQNTMKNFPGIKSAGFYSPDFGFEKSSEECKKVIQRINEFCPDILFVCLGCPKQEEFVLEYMDSIKACSIICAGATVDFVAGNVSRAPGWVSKAGIEWLYRFFKEPKRLFRRYFIDSWHFVGMLMKNKQEN